MLVGWSKRGVRKVTSEKQSQDNSEVKVQEILMVPEEETATYHPQASHAVFE